MSSERPSGWLYLSSNGILLGSLVITYFLILTPTFVGDDLDSSWRAALLQARYLGLGFGNQIVFTGGPLSHVYTRTFTSSLFHEQILSIFLFSGFYMLFFADAVGRSNKLFVAIIGAIPFSLSFLTDPVFIGLPLCVTLLSTLPASNRRCLAIAVGAAASAVATLAKFSVFPIALAGFLITDLLALKNKRFPTTSLVYAVALTFVFYLTSPNGSLIEFIRASLEVSLGYAEAMSISGPIVEVGLIFACAAIITGLIALNEFRSVRIGKLDVSSALGRVAIVCIFLLVCMKGGLIRHDGHALIAWFGLALLAAIYCAFSWQAFSPGMAMTFVALTMASMVLTCGSRYYHPPASSNASSVVAKRTQEYANWVMFLSHPLPWLSAQEAKQEAAYEQIRAKHVWPPIDGTLDIIPSRQSALIANHLRYQPRPSIQQYITYSAPGLVEKNRAFFRSSRAPDFLLMAPEALDNHHPATTEGPIWPDLLALYAPQDIVDGMALLRKRDHPLNLPMRQLETRDGALDQPVNLAPIPRGVIFARIDLQPTFLGRLANFIFKSALLYMDVQYTNGSKARYRFSPAIAREGFLLSPLIESGDKFFALSAGLANTSSVKVKSFSVRSGTLAQWLWDKTFTVRLDAMAEDALRADIKMSGLGPGGKQELELLSVMDRHPDANLALLPEGMLAHAPTKLTVPTEGDHMLEIAFGILDNAWKGDANTDGVCFQVSDPVSSMRIWERCLDPKQTSADRGPQQARITLPEGTTGIVLETICGKHCAWDWSYWRRISLR